MTFYEAAVEVLRRSGRPLHFKKITEVAIRDALLSHIGKTPESTMEDRLNLETKKEDASWIVRTRPGVYMLRNEVAERLNTEAAEREAEAQRLREEEEARLRQLEEDSEQSSEADDVENAEDSEDSEDSRDEDSEDSDDEESASDDNKQGRRRRRRRGGRGRSRRSRSNGDDDDEAEENSNDDDQPEAVEADDDEADDDDSDTSTDSGDGDDDTSKSRRRRGRGRGRRNGRGKKSESDSFDGLQGERCDSVAEAAHVVLRSNARKAMSAAEVADVVFDKKLVKFHTHDPEVTIESAIVTDNQVRERTGRRPLFAPYREGRWGLTEWGVTDDGIEKERSIIKLAASLREEAHDQLGEAIARLKSEAFEMVVMTLLERLGYRNLKVSKRTSDGDTYFSADWRRGFSDMRVCVCVIGSAERKLEASAINGLRETLEHYSASEGTVIHMGEVAKDAVKALRDDSEANVTIIDRRALVRLLVEEGIGVRTFQTPLVMVDTAFIDALQR